MPRTSDFIRLALVTIFALSLGTGCTKAAKKERYQTQAENDFKAGSYDKAKIEYLNVLRFDPQNAPAFKRLGQIWMEEGAPLKAGAFLVKASELEPNDLENRLRLARTYQAVGRHDQAKKEVLFVLQHSPDDGDALLLLSEIALTPEEIASAEQALQKSTKESAASQLAAANLAIRKSDLKTAGTAIARALELEPRSPRAHQSAGILALLQQDQKRAGAEFKTAAELSPARSNLKTVYPEYLLKTGATDQAKQYLQGLTSKTPDFLPAWILQARIALAAKNYGQTLALLENVISRDSDNLDARVIQANSWLAKNETAKAVSALERLNSSYPGAPALKVELAKAYIQSGKFPQAAAVLQEAVTASPNYADAVLLLSEINLRNGQAGPAITALEGLLKTRPDIVKAQTLLADAYRAAGRLDDSAAVFRQQIARTPEKPEPYFFLGVVQRQQNKTADARQSFNKALELAPDSAETLTQLVELDLVAKDFTGAMSLVQRLQEKKPGDAFPYLLAGKVRAAQKQWPEAETALKKAIQLNPDLSTAYDLLVAIYLSTNRLPQAAQELENILVKSPHNQPALMALASLREKEKNYAKAAEIYRRLLAFKPDSVPALNNLAYLDAERLNQLGNAEELARKARTLAPADPAVADTLGWVLFKSGDYEHALELVSEAAGKSPNSPEVQFHLGMAHYMMGQTEAAASAFHHALSLQGDFPSKTEAQRRLDILEKTSKGAEASGVDELEAMVKQYPNDVIARMKLGELYAKQNLFDRAAAAYREALKLNPKLAPVALSLTQLYAGPLHDPAAALEFAKKARDLAPNDPQVADTLGKIAFDVGNYTWAYSVLQDGVRQSGAGAPIFYHFAWAAYSLGKVEQARQAMEKSLQASPEPQMAQDTQTFLALTAVGPEDPGALASAEPRIREKLAADPNYVPAVMAAAASDIQSGKTEEAIVRYQSVLKKFPDFAPAQRQLASLYANDPARLAEAYDLASKARKMLPGDPATAALLGQLSYQKKEYPRAIQLLQESDRAKPLDAKGLYFLGMADKESNHPTEAKDALKKALAKGLPQPMTESAQKALGELDKNP